MKVQLMPLKLFFGHLTLKVGCKINMTSIGHMLV